MLASVAMSWTARVDRIASLTISVIVVMGCAADPTTVTTPTSVATQRPSVVATADGSATASTPAATPSRSPTPDAATSPSVSTEPGRPTATTEPTTAATAPDGAIQIAMAGPPPVFRPKTITAPVGDLVFYLVNQSPTRDTHGVHTVAIGPEQGVPIVVSDEVRGGERAVFTVRGLGPGTYAVWCTFPGHAGLGQTGTLTVE